MTQQQPEQPPHSDPHPPQQQQQQQHHPEQPPYSDPHPPQQQYGPQPQYAYGPQPQYPQQQYHHPPHPQYPPQQYQPYQQPYPHHPQYPQQQPYPQYPQYPQQQQQPYPQQFYGSGDVLERVFGPNGRCLVEQEVELLEVFTGFETENKYSVTFENGLKAVALEDSGFFARWCLGSSRPFKMHVVFKDTRQEFLFFERPYKFLLSEIRIYDSSKGPEQRVLLGKVAQKFTLCTREFNVRDDQGKLIYQIVGDCLSTFASSMCPMFTTPSFYIIDPSTRERIGEIKKKWSGFIKEMYTKADNFGVQFPAKSTPKEKALLFAATFLIDFLFFEEKQNNNNRNRY